MLPAYSRVCCAATKYEDKGYHCIALVASNPCVAMTSPHLVNRGGQPDGLSMPVPGTAVLGGRSCHNTFTILAAYCLGSTKQLCFVPQNKKVCAPCYLPAPTRAVGGGLCLCHQPRPVLQRRDGPPPATACWCPGRVCNSERLNRRFQVSSFIFNESKHAVRGISINEIGVSPVITILLSTFTPCDLRVESVAL